SPVNIGSVNTVDPAQIQSIISKGFTEPPPDKASGKGGGKGASKPRVPAKPAAPAPPASTVTVDVYNAGAPSGYARLVSTALVGKGYVKGVAQTAVTKQSATTVTYGAGASANAQLIAKYFGGTAAVSSSVAAGHVQVVLGSSTTSMPAGLSGGSAGTG